MKKTLIALAAVAATGAAFAQSSVTLYGRLGATYGTTTTKNGAGVTTAKQTGLIDGSNLGLAGSRWGMKGSEDLGGGLKANFQLEQRFNLNDGEAKSTRQFHAQSWVGLSGGFGEVRLGRVNAHTFGLIDATDADATSSFSTNDDTAALINGVRADNMVAYMTPSFGGAVVKLGLVNQKTATNAKQTAADVTVEYGAGPLFVGVGFGNNKTVVADKTTAKNNGYILAGTYDFGSAKLFSNYISNKNKVTNTTTSDFTVGVRVPVGAVSLVASVGRDKFKTGSVSNSATDWNIGADYALSKRTLTYARLAKNGITGGGKVDKFGVGIQHNF